jgi:hypothetical protein
MIVFKIKRTSRDLRALSTGSCIRCSARRIPSGRGSETRSHVRSPVRRHIRKSRAYRCLKSRNTHNIFSTKYIYGIINSTVGIESGTRTLESGQPLFIVVVVIVVVAIHIIGMVTNA